MNAAAAKPSVTLEEATDEQILDEVEVRGLAPEEKDTGDFSDDEIRNEFDARFSRYSHISPEQVFDELYRTRADVPQIVKDYIYSATGRTLP